LAIADADALAAAWHRMEKIVPGSDGFLVETMAAPGVEMIVGARRDPDWGPVIVVGLGGVWTEALADVRVMPAGLPKETIITEIHALKGAPLLRGFRSLPPSDLHAVAEVAMRIAAAMLARPEIIEIDVNPLAVYADSVLALDALIVSSAPHIAAG